MKKMWRTILSACCAVVILVTLAGVYVRADELQENSVPTEIYEEAAVPDDISDVCQAESDTLMEDVNNSSVCMDDEARLDEILIEELSEDELVSSYDTERWQWTDEGVKQERCTYRAWHEAYDRGYVLPTYWGNACSWAADARKAGYRVDAYPSVNSIVCWSGGSSGWGHVAYVTGVDRTNVYIREGGINPDNGAYFRDTSFSRSEPNRWGGYTFEGYIHLTNDVNSLEIEAGYYKIQYGGNRFLNVSGNLTDDGTNIDIYSSVTYPGQTFYIDWNWNHSGYYMQHQTSQKFVTTDTNSYGCHNVNLQTGNGNDGQQWAFEDAGDGNVYIRNLYGYYLDVVNGTNADQQNVQVWNYNGGSPQKWRLVRVSGEGVMSVDPGYYKLQYGGNRFLNVSGNLTDDGTNIDIYSSVTYPGQTFYINWNWNHSGYYMQHQTSQKFVSTDTNSTGIHNVNLLSGNGNDGQQWIIEDAGDGYVYVRNLYGYYLDVANGTNADQQNVQVWKYYGGWSQKWKLIKLLSEDNCTVNLAPTSFTYEGKQKKPTVTVKCGTTTLKKDTDYTVSYSNNTNAGTATVTITGKGNYTGAISKNFTINKAAAKLSFANTSVSKTTKDAAFTNALTKTTDGAVAFKSSNTGVATVNSTSGKVTIKGAGTATITAMASAGKNYKAGSTSYTLTVTASATAGFSDVQDPSHPYYKAIYWAADAGITKGYPDGTFGINRACTRSEAVMFLWRMAGNPTPKEALSSPFKDVPKSHAHYKAILWASQKGITKGYSDGTFGINQTCTRGQIMTFIWRFKGQPAPKAVVKSPFSDVPKNHAYYKAILWGSQAGVTNGYSDGTFGINKDCTRGQIVTFLYRIK